MNGQYCTMFIFRFFRYGRYNPDDARRKSLFKTISWRVLASSDTLMIAWLLTGNLKTAQLIMWLEIFTKRFSTMCTSGFGYGF